MNTGSADYPRPSFRLTVGGQDITEHVNPRLISLQLTDNRGTEADQLDLALDDSDGKLEIPPHGASIQVWLGWNTTGLVDKGTFTVDETVHAGTPDTLTIRARSADLREGLAAKKERSWHGTTLGEIARKVAAENELKAEIAADLDDVPVKHMDQTNESDINLLTRLAKENDAIAAIKGGSLLLFSAGTGKSVGGIALQHRVLTRMDGDSHSFQQADRDSYSGVTAQYNDGDEFALKEAQVGEEKNTKRLRNMYPTKEAAEKAAQAESQRLQRGNATLTYTLARGIPDLVPECTFQLQGIKPEIAAFTWLGVKVTHSLGDSGYTASIEAESKASEGSK